MNLVLIAADEQDPSGRVVLEGAQAYHLLAVLRVTPGQAVRVGLIDGPCGSGIVREVGHGRVTLDCTFQGGAPPRPRVDVLLALPRPKVMRRLWAQLAALGVGRIILTNAARVERNYFDSHVITEACYRPLLLEGLQQARDTRVPTVTVHRQFRRLVEDGLEQLSDATLRLIADPHGNMMKPDPARHAGRVLLAVGPEGGWNEFERALLASRGFQPMALGPRTLRSDTACIAVLTVAHRLLS